MNLKQPLCLLLAALAASQARADETPLAYTRANYTKYEYRVTMRDGVKLFTEVYAPKDHSKTYPILMLRTPYSVGPYGVDNYRESLGPADSFEKEQFIFVYQDVRGRYESEGTFVDVPIAKERLNGLEDTDEGSDTYDTIDWLVRNVPHNNGRVGIWGISYPGFYAAFSLIRSHPALKAVSPQAPMGDVGNGDDSYHNGAFYLAANFRFYMGFKPRGPNPNRFDERNSFDFHTPDQYEFYLRMGPLANATNYMKEKNVYWTDTLEHPNYDEFWSSRALAPHMRHVTPAVLFVGGWFDAEDLSGPLKCFRAVEKMGGAPANSLAMGPWRHGGWAGSDGQTLGSLNFASKTAEFFTSQIELPFFVQVLKDKKNVSSLPKAWLFATGVNEWRQFDAWPPKDASHLSLYLGPGGTLSFSQAQSSNEEFDEYVSDPAKPVPVFDGIGEGMPGDYMTRDQRFASRRTDVLTYQTPPLDHDVTIAGPIKAALRVSTSGSDSDYIVKLIDVYPDDYADSKSEPPGVRMGGFQQLVRGEPFRGKFRHSLSRPEPFVPGQPDSVGFSMPDVLHVFRTGHRIMVQIESSWFPMVDRNPQQFLDIPTAKASDFQKATERVYYNGPNGSRLDVITTSQ